MECGKLILNDLEGYMNYLEYIYICLNIFILAQVNEDPSTCGKISVAPYFGPVSMTYILFYSSDIGPYWYTMQE